MRRAYRVFRHRLLYQIFALTLQALSRRLCYNVTPFSPPTSFTMKMSMSKSSSSESSQSRSSNKMCYCVRCGKSWTRYTSRKLKPTKRPQACRFCNSRYWYKPFYIHVCYRCGQWWKSETLSPKVCTHCKSIYWSVPFCGKKVDSVSFPGFKSLMSDTAEILDGIKLAHSSPSSFVQTRLKKLRSILRSDTESLRRKYNEYENVCEQATSRSIRDVKESKTGKFLKCEIGDNYYKIHTPPHATESRYRKSLQEIKDNYINLNECIDTFDYIDTTPPFYAHRPTK